MENNSVVRNSVSEKCKNTLDPTYINILKYTFAFIWFLEYLSFSLGTSGLIWKTVENLQVDSLEFKIVKI